MNSRTRSKLSLRIAIAIQILVALTVGMSPHVAIAQQGAPMASDERRALQDQIDALQRRLSELEASAVLSEPETRVIAKEVWVDENGIEQDPASDVAARGRLKKQITYQRATAYRRQTIGEKVEEALSDAESNRVQLGIDASAVVQRLSQTSGRSTSPDEEAYGLAAADLYFSAQVARNTLFFVNLVGFSGSTPDEELLDRPLALNGYGARLDDPDEINLREALIETSFGEERLTLTAGRIDLTNYFDANTVANDEKSQFLADPLVNNPALGLSSNGTGATLAFDAKDSLRFRLGVQQSAESATNLGDSVFSVAEIAYLARPFSLPEGNYRVWYRLDNSADETRDGFGLSFDQKLNSAFTLFTRYGRSEAEEDKDEFWSVGFQLRTAFVLNPGDVWGLGYANADLGDGGRQRLTELYYNFQLAARLGLTFNVQYTSEALTGQRDASYFVPGIRLRATY
jgi:hypothetical protein